MSDDMLNARLDAIDKRHDSLDIDLKTNYVRKEAFEPIKAIVYKAVSTILVMVFGAIGGLVFYKGDMDKENQVTLKEQQATIEQRFEQQNQLLIKMLEEMNKSSEIKRDLEED